VKKVLVVIIIILGLKMFDFIIFNTTWLNTFIALSAIIMLISIIISKNTRKIKTNFKNVILFFYLGIALNFILMFFYYNLSLYDSLFGLINFSGFIFYFFLHKNQYSLTFLAKLGLFIAILVAILMILQQVFSNTPMFNQLINHDHFIGDRGTVRVRIPGMAFVVIAFFIFFYKSIHNYKVLYLVISLAFFVVLMLQGFRSIAVSVIICSIYIYWKSHSINKLFSIKNLYFFLLLPLIVVFAFQVEYINNIFQGMLDAFIRDQDIGEDNIRLQSWDYYLFAIKTNAWMYFTGNGMKLPFVTPDNLFAVDLGIWGFYALAGFIPTVAILFAFFKGLMIEPNNNFIFINCFFLYILLNCFLFNAEAFRIGIFYIYSMLFYVIDVNIYNKSNILQATYLKQ
jgi:hypothetical protein